MKYKHLLWLFAIILIVGAYFGKLFNILLICAIFSFCIMGIVWGFLYMISRLDDKIF